MNIQDAFAQFKPSLIDGQFEIELYRDGLTATIDSIAQSATVAISGAKNNRYTYDALVYAEAHTHLHNSGGRYYTDFTPQQRDEFFRFLLTIPFDQKPGIVEVTFQGLIENNPYRIFGSYGHLEQRQPDDLFGYSSQFPTDFVFGRSLSIAISHGNPTNLDQIQTEIIPIVELVKTLNTPHEPF